MKRKLEKLIKKVLVDIGMDDVVFTVEHPTDLNMGDYSTNAAFVAMRYAAKFVGSNVHGKFEWARYKSSNPLDVANDIRIKLGNIDGVEIKVVAPGFINFHLSKDFYKESLREIIKKKNSFGKNKHLNKQVYWLEHTQPNPFKEIHIGHLMNNTIGESIFGLLKANGAQIETASYHGDKGLHVAKAVWAMKNHVSYEKAYADGNKKYEENENIKKEIIEINRKIYEGNDEEIKKIYEEGMQKFIKHFSSFKRRLNTNLKHVFYESHSGEIGKMLVLENVGRVFEESDGAIVFKGEKYGLHTRVFLNSERLPTYEAKELGLANIKNNKHSFDKSITITGNEQDAFFKVTEVAIGKVFPQLNNKLQHLSHGMLRLELGSVSNLNGGNIKRFSEKMSSRTGNIITAEELIDKVKKRVKNAMEKTNKVSGPILQRNLPYKLAIAAIKYMILRQTIGHDIIFDFEKSVSTEGDSGVYLQYAHARANSILEKAGKTGNTEGEAGETREIEKLLYRFPEIVERAGAEYAPNYITTYLTELASSFNNFYAHEQVLDDTPQAPYRLAIVQAFKTVMKNGLTILGIPAPERM